MTNSARNRLGRTGLQIPPIVYGTSYLGNLYKELNEVVKLEIIRKWFECVEKPVFIDTAGKYGAGLALEVIGKLLDRLEISPEDIVISNKLGWYRIPLKGPEPTFEPGVWAGIKHDAIQKISYNGILECREQGNDLLGGKYRADLLSVHDPDEYMLTKEFNHGIGLLKKFNLVYDILIFEKQLPAAIQLVDHHPDQLFVIDHIAKPRIAENILSPWKENICKLAERPNVYCKISGTVTEADFNSWTRQQLKPYMDTVMEAFGPDRLMFGSDWPVCLTACEYEEWLNLVKNWLGQLSVEEQAMIMGENAVNVYRL